MPPPVGAEGHVYTGSTIQRSLRLGEKTCSQGQDLFFYSILFCHPGVASAVRSARELLHCKLPDDVDLFKICRRQSTETSEFVRGKNAFPVRQEVLRLLFFHGESL